MALVTAELVRKIGGCGNGLLPASAVRESKVNIPREITAVGQLHTLAKSGSEVHVAIPIVCGTRIGNEFSCSESRPVFVLLQNGCPHHVDGKTLVLYLVQELSLHHTGAVPAAGSRGSKNDNHPYLVRPRIECLAQVGLILFKVLDRRSPGVDVYSRIGPNQQRAVAALVDCNRKLLQGRIADLDTFECPAEANVVDLDLMATDLQRTVETRGQDIKLSCIVAEATDTPRRTIAPRRRSSTRRTR